MDFTFKPYLVTPAGICFKGPFNSDTAPYWGEALRPFIGCWVWACDVRPHLHSSLPDVLLVFPTLGAGSACLAAHRLTDAAQLLPPAATSGDGAATPPPAPPADESRSAANRRRRAQGSTIKPA